MSFSQRKKSSLLICYVGVPTSTMRSNIIDESSNAMPQTRLRNDGIYEPHEDLGCILVTEGHAGVLI
jgi:hypothetical protein